MINKNELPSLTIHPLQNTTIEKFKYNLIDEEHKIYTSVLALNEEGNRTIREGIKKLHKPFGSDYIITEESSDLVNDNGEQEIFAIGDCLVELKATGRDYASMTTLQAHTAAENIERYVLIVLPLDGNTPDIEYVRNNARVISDIGDRVKSVVDSYDKLEGDRDALDIGVDGVSVNIEDKNVRFRVDADIWNSSKMYIEDFMKKYFRSY